MRKIDNTIKCPPFLVRTQERGEIAGGETLSLLTCTTLVDSRVFLTWLMNEWSRSERERTAERASLPMLAMGGTSVVPVVCRMFILDQQDDSIDSDLRVRRTKGRKNDERMGYRTEQNLPLPCRGRRGRRVLRPPSVRPPTLHSFHLRRRPSERAGSIAMRQKRERRSERATPKLLSASDSSLLPSPYFLPSFGQMERPSVGRSVAVAIGHVALSVRPSIRLSNYPAPFYVNPLVPLRASSGAGAAGVIYLFICTVIVARMSHKKWREI